MIPLRLLEHIAQILVWVSMGDHCRNGGWLFRNFKFGWV